MYTKHPSIEDHIRANHLHFITKGMPLSRLRAMDAVQIFKNWYNGYLGIDDDGRVLPFRGKLIEKQK